MSMRILTELEKIILTALNKSIGVFNYQLRNSTIKVETIDIHLVDRIKDRQLYPEDVNFVLQQLARNNLCELIFDCERQNKSFVQFTVQLDEILFLHGTYRKTQVGNLITFRTVIPYRTEYNYNDFLYKVSNK